jgi:hypothetical protein
MNVLRIAVPLAALVPVAWAQDATRGFTFNMTVDGTTSVLGAIMRFDPTAGYRLNRYTTFEVGIPFFYVKPSDTALEYQGATSGSGLGNAHAALRLNFDTETVIYRPSLTITAPTGDKDRGLSTGHLTWDWDNLIQRTFGRVTPYASAGIANTISDSPLFLRPYTTKGFVGHFEGGALFSLANRVSVGASAYAYEPSGEQTVISRVAQGNGVNATQPGTPADTGDGGSTGTPGNGTGSGNGQGTGNMPGSGGNPGMSGANGNSRSARNRGNRPPAVWETASETTGAADIARDRGASVWLSVAPSRYTTFYAGYSRSTTYALNTVFLGVGINVGAVLRNRIF